jgi:ribosomal protein L34E
MKSTPPKYIKTPADKEVDKMLKNWSKIRCKRCGKMINMLTADPLPDGRGFVCKGGNCRA